MNDKFWHEVSLVVDGEMAEAVAEVLRRYIPDGVVIEFTAVKAGPADENGQTVGPLRVCGYIPVDEHLDETRQSIEQGLWYLGRISPLPAPEFKLIKEVKLDGSMEGSLPSDPHWPKVTDIASLDRATGSRAHPDTD